MTSKYAGFFSDLDEAPTKKPSKYDAFFSDIIESPEQNILGYSQAPIRGAASVIISAPRTISGLLKGGSRYLAGKGQELAQREGREIGEDEASFTKKMVELFGYPDEVLEKMGLPTYSEATEMLREGGLQDAGFEEGNLPEMTGLEHGLETAGAFLGGSALTPGASFGTTSRGISSGLSALGAGGAAAMGGEEGAQIGAALALPAAFKAIQMIRTGQLMPSGAEARELYEFGKANGMTEAELTPILQSKGRRRLLGSVAQKTDRAKAQIETSKKSLGKLYDKSKQEGRKLGKASLKSEKKFLIDIDDVLTDLNSSKMPSETKQMAIKKIQNFMGDVYENGISADEIIATWQDINDAVDWHSFSGGSTSLAALKKPMEQLLTSISPTIAKEFKMTNTMWGDLQKTARKIVPNEMTKILNMGEVGALGGALYSLVTTGNPAALAAVIGEKGGRYLATEMLTNPRLNNLVNKTMASMTSGSPSVINKSLRNFEEQLKKMPGYPSEEE